MANCPRNLIVFDGSIFHVTWKCHNNDWLLGSDFAKNLYYGLLLKYKTAYGIEFYSYCFMDNHPHLSGKCYTQKRFSDFFRVVNSCFAKTLNQELKRKGQAVMDRFKSPVMESDEDLMNVMIYTDLNPSRTTKGTHPCKHKWTSYHHYAFGKHDPLLTDPPCYLNLGETPEKRQNAYQHMIDEIIKNDDRTPKCPYRKECGSLAYFVGNPNWVTERYAKVSAETSRLRKDWRDRNRNFWAGSHADR